MNCGGREEMKRPFQFKAQCLVCDHKGTVLHNSKEEYLEVTVCPKCNGAFVDTWKLHKYLNSTNNQIEITMTNPNEPPIIKLNGQFIDGIISLEYKYETKGETTSGQHNFTVKYLDKESDAIRTVSANKMWEG